MSDEEEQDWMKEILAGKERMKKILAKKKEPSPEKLESAVGVAATAPPQRIIVKFGAKEFRYSFFFTETRIFELKEKIARDTYKDPEKYNLKLSISDPEKIMDNDDAFLSEYGVENEQTIYCTPIKKLEKNEVLCCDV